MSSGGAILVFLPNWIGDVVMATPAIRALRAHFPTQPLIAVCKPYVADTLAGAPWFDEVVLFDKSGPPERRVWAALKRLRQYRPDTAVLFPNSFRAAALAKLAGCETIVGFARYGRDFLLTHRLYAARTHGGEFLPTPMLDDYNRIVIKLGVSDPGTRMELFTSSDDETLVTKVLQDLRLDRFSRIIGLNPGGAFGASKHWPTEYFSEVAHTLSADPDTGVVVLCGPSERDEANRITSLTAKPNVVSLSGAPLSIGLSKAIVKRLALLVTTDSGPRHFAAAFDVPVVTLFGPTHIGWTETYFAKAIHLQKAVPCGPCQQRVCPLGHHRCMTELVPTDVISTSQLLLRRFTDELPEMSRHAH